MESVNFKKTHPGKGALLDVDAIKRELTRESWEEDPEDDTRQVRRVWLGSIFGLTPSGKVYMPWACSNVMGCDSCHGTGRILLRKERRVKKWQRAYLNARVLWDKRRSSYEACTGPALHPSAKRGAATAFRNYNNLTRTCTACGGLGSREAYLDERWNEYVEEVAEACDAYAEWSDGDLFISQSRDREDDESEEEDDHAVQAD